MHYFFGTCLNIVNTPLLRLTTLVTFSVLFLLFITTPKSWFLHTGLIGIHTRSRSLSPHPPHSDPEINGKVKGKMDDLSGIGKDNATTAENVET